MSRLGMLTVGMLALIIMAAVGWFSLKDYGERRYEAGHAAAVAERALADAKATLVRTGENAALAAHQDKTNSTITKEKDDEIADLRSRLAAAGRLRVGFAVCPDRPAAPAQAESAAGGDGADPSAGLVSARADADFKQLIEAVETDLATGRACQSFLRENGLQP